MFFRFLSSFLVLNWSTCYKLQPKPYQKKSSFYLIRILLEINFLLSNFLCQNVQTMVRWVGGGSPNQVWTPKLFAFTPAPNRISDNGHGHTSPQWAPMWHFVNMGASLYDAPLSPWVLHWLNLDLVANKNFFYLKDWQSLSISKEISLFCQRKSLKSNAFWSNYNDF